MERKPYPSDLTNAQWRLIAQLIPAAKPGGRPRAVDRREVLTTLLSLQRTGCHWDMLPHDLLPQSTVSEYFSQVAPGGHLAADDGRTARGSAHATGPLAGAHPKCCEYR